MISVKRVLHFGDVTDKAASDAQWHLQVLCVRYSFGHPDNSIIFSPKFSDVFRVFLIFVMPLGSEAGMVDLDAQRQSTFPSTF